jgi:hypothetical protein
MSTKVDTVIEAFYSRVRGSYSPSQERQLIQTDRLARRWQSTCTVKDAEVCNLIWVLSIQKIWCKEMLVSNRYCPGAILLFALVVPIIGCSNSQVGSIQITPASQSLVAGQTAHFTATGIIGHGNHPATNEDVTNQVTWTSNAPAIATISSSGVASGVSAGSATITASMTGGLSATASIAVTGATVSSGSDVVSLSVIPGTQSVTSPQQTGQFIAIGTTAAGTTEDLTG